MVVPVKHHGRILRDPAATGGALPGCQSWVRFGRVGTGLLAAGEWQDCQDRGGKTVQHLLPHCEILDDLGRSGSATLVGRRDNGTATVVSQGRGHLYEQLVALGLDGGSSVANPGSRTVRSLGEMARSAQQADRILASRKES